MTEEEWQKCEDAFFMFAHLEALAVGSDRKWQLIALTACRRMWYLLDRKCRKLVELGEGYAEGTLSELKLNDAWKGVERELRKANHLEPHKAVGAWGAVRQSVLLATMTQQRIRKQAGGSGRGDKSISGWRWAADHSWIFTRKAIGESLQAESTVEEVRKVVGEVDTLERGVLYETFGNPFRPVAVESSWFTSPVVALAEGIYAERAFDRMPILADALEDAGCDNGDILNHCRQPGEHVRGCWVVDLLTGRK